MKKLFRTLVPMTLVAAGQLESFAYDNRIVRNFILATFPLRKLVAVELPFERERRVAISADITTAPSGKCAPVRPFASVIKSGRLSSP